LLHVAFEHGHVKAVLVAVPLYKVRWFSKMTQMSKSPRLKKLKIKYNVLGAGKPASTIPSN
jgi:hypothetical protein